MIIAQYVGNLMKINFDTFCEKYGSEILDNIENNIENLNIPNSVKKNILRVLEDSETDILEYNYYCYLGTYENDCYEQYKESKIF